MSVSHACILIPQSLNQLRLHRSANIYSAGVSEIITGKAVKKYNLNRDELVIATKLFGTVVRNGDKTQGKSKQEMALMGYANQQGE